MVLGNLIDNNFINQSLIKVFGDDGVAFEPSGFLLFILISFAVGFLFTMLIYSIFPNTKAQYSHWKNESKKVKAVINFLIGGFSLLVVGISIELINIVRFTLNLPPIEIPLLFVGMFALMYSYWFYLVYSRLKKVGNSPLLSYRWIPMFLFVSFALSLNIASIGGVFIFMKYASVLLGISFILFIIMMDFMLLFPFLIKREKKTGAKVRGVNK